jgi:hypothetical protein
MYYTKEQIDRANAVSLESFLAHHGEALVKSGNEHRWKAHDSLTIRGNKWFRHSEGKGGGPIDFVMEFYGKTFPEAMEMLIMEKAAEPVEAVSSPMPDFRLPARNVTNVNAINYLVKERGISEEIVQTFMDAGDIYEDTGHHNVVFIGRDQDGLPRYAHCRGTSEKFRQDVAGSDKSFGFCYQGTSDMLCVFEAPIDLLSFICLFPKDWQTFSYLSLGGVSSKALEHFLSEREDIRKIYLCLDADDAGAGACVRIAREMLDDKMEIFRMEPALKDWNEVLLHNDDLTEGRFRMFKYNPVKEHTVPMIRMSDVELTEVKWLWKPYIPFGKLTILQGNPGEGKTYFAMQLAAACTNRVKLPGMEEIDPFNVIYQTAEDGLGDTVKPRLLEAGADLDRVLVINEQALGGHITLSDREFETAIKENDAKLLIIDPIQAFLGANVDMNRANEVRPIFRWLGDMAERTGCAIVLIGHLNKASGMQSTYRGLGSIDFTASVRSLLFIGKVKEDPNLRVLTHEKCSLAPLGESLAFILGDDEGFRWIGPYEITADELLSGSERNKETKTQEARDLICSMLAGGKQVLSEEIDQEALKRGISSRTVRDAKKELGSALKSRIGTGRKKIFWME